MTLHEAKRLGHVVLFQHRVALVRLTHGVPAMADEVVVHTRVLEVVDHGSHQQRQHPVGRDGVVLLVRRQQHMRGLQHVRGVDRVVERVVQVAHLQLAHEHLQRVLVQVERLVQAPPLEHLARDMQQRRAITHVVQRHDVEVPAVHVQHDAPDAQLVFRAVRQAVERVPPPPDVGVVPLHERRDRGAVAEPPLPLGRHGQSAHLAQLHDVAQRVTAAAASVDSEGGHGERCRGVPTVSLLLGRAHGRDAGPSRRNGPVVVQHEATVTAPTSGGHQGLHTASCAVDVGEGPSPNATTQLHRTPPRGAHVRRARHCRRPRRSGTERRQRADAWVVHSAGQGSGALRRRPGRRRRTAGGRSGGRERGRARWPGHHAPGATPHELLGVVAHVVEARAGGVRVNADAAAAGRDALRGDDGGRGHDALQRRQVLHLGPPLGLLGGRWCGRSGDRIVLAAVVAAVRCGRATTGAVRGAPAVAPLVLRRRAASLQAAAAAADNDDAAAQRPLTPPQLLELRVTRLGGIGDARAIATHAGQLVHLHCTGSGVACALLRGSQPSRGATHGDGIVVRVVRGVGVDGSNGLHRRHTQ